jgi:hypothetical protein
VITRLNGEARLSKEGWSSCYACNGFLPVPTILCGCSTAVHAVPFRCVGLRSAYPKDAKVLNHSAVNDEVQDFELNMRDVSGGLGPITCRMA